MLVRITTDNDKNGNPRRGWLFTADDGTLADFIDEGYMGEREALEFYGFADPDLEPVVSVSIKVSPSEFRRLRKLGQEVGK